MNVHVGPQMKHNTLFDSKTVNVKKKPVKWSSVMLAL